ncbi:MAG: glycosyltransferase family 2 protein [Chloroflexota bacterium]
MSGDISVSIVVVTWNGLAHLERCLPAALAQHLDGRDTLELIVVDNASADGTPDYLQGLAKRDTRVRLLRNDYNLGFAGPNNQGIEFARGEFVATLNNDAPPEPAWLAALLDTARTDARIGSVASRMVFAHAPDVVQSAGIAIDRAAIAWDRDVGRPVAHCDRGVTEVFGASAGAALYRRTMLRELGGFDSRFFLYLEDVDLAWRARLAGWRAVHAPRAVVRHAHSASAKEGSPLKNWHLGRNKVWTTVKCYPAAGLRRYLGAVVAYDLASLPYTVSTKRDLSAVTGRLAALRGLAPFLRERAHLQRRHPDGWAMTREWMEPLKTPREVFGRYRRLRRVLSGTRV